MQLMHIKRNWVLTALCVSAFLNGCGKQEEIPHHASNQLPATHQESIKTESLVYPEGDVRRRFIGEAKPLLDENSLVQLWAGSQKKDKPEMLVKELDYPTLEYASDGTLYFIGDHQDAIVGIFPDGSSKVIVRSGVMGYVTPDGGTQPEPMYNTFEGLILTDKGRLLTMQNSALPYEIDVGTGEMSFLDMTTPTGEVFRNEFDMMKSSGFNSQFAFIRSDGDWILLYNQPDRTWYRYKKSENLEKIENPMSLNNPNVYLNVTDQYGITIFSR